MRPGWEVVAMQTSKAVGTAWPTVTECSRAKEVFAHFLRRYANCPGMSREKIIACAIDQVWRAGCIYQQAKDTTENHADAVRLYESIVRGGAGL